MGDPADTRRTRSNFEEPLVALTATKPFSSRHIFLVHYSYPQSYGEVVGNPFWEFTMQEDTNPSLRTILGIWFFFLQEGNFSGADRSTRPRAQ